MTGPEHYREAERVLRAAAVADPESALVMAQRAAAHATLALAAAQAFAVADRYVGDSDHVNTWLATVRENNIKDAK